MTEEEWLDEIRDAISYKIESIITDEIRKLSVDATALEEKLKDINLYHFIGDKLESIVSNAIGNRLRCWIYDGSLMDKAFESVWTEQLQKAMEDRIRNKVDTFIDKSIQDKLKEFMK